MPVPLAVAAGAVSAGVGVANFFRSLFQSGKQRKRERGQVGALQEQFGVLGERLEGTGEEFDLLREFAQQGVELEEKGISQRFIEESFSLGQRERESIRSSGLAKGGTEGAFDIEREFGERGLRQSQERLRLNREGELIGIGRAETAEERSLQDMMFAIESQILGKGGSLGFAGLNQAVSEGILPEDVLERFRQNLIGG